MTDSIAICISFHGQHRKSGGTIGASDHIRMLSASIERLNSADKFTTVVSAIKLTMSEREDRDLQRSLFRLLPVTRIVTTIFDYPHQDGAARSIYQGLLACDALGAEWMFFTAEDVIFEDVNAVSYWVGEAQRAQVDVLSRPFLDDVGIKALGTQAFVCRIRSLLGPDAESHVFHPSFFDAGAYNGVEHYFVQTLINHHIPYLRTWDFDYIHAHDPVQFFEIYDRLGGNERSD